MANVRFHKVVSALPGTLEPDAIYAVRVGEGFDLYISDSTGSVAHKVNGGVSEPPVAPTFTTPASISPASGPIGTVFTLSEGVATGTAPITLTGVLMLGAADVTSEIAAGEYTSTAAGTLTWTVTASNGTLPNATSSDTSAVIDPEAAALDPATANIMFVSNSLVSNRIEGNSFEGGTFGPVYPWADDFRPEYTGSAGTANSPGYLFHPSSPAIGNDNVGSRTKARWDQPDTFWAANCDPRRDLAGMSALVINQANLGGTIRPYQWSNATMDVQMREDVDYTLQFVAAAAAAGVSQIIVDGDPPQLLSTADNADDSAWRAAITGAERAHHYMRDRVRAWLDANGHAGVSVRVIPYHRLAARLYDDAIATTIPDSITTHRALYAGWGEGGSTTHVYMRNRRGQLFENLLWSRVVFGRMPDTSGDYTARGVSSALMAYAVSIVEDIASTYAPAGLGGTDDGEIGMVPYDGETPAQIMPDATVHLIDFAASTLYSDRAGTTAAVDGGPVGRIVSGPITFTAGSDGARPVLDGEMIHFTADPMPGTLPASIAARYIAGIMPMIATTSDNITIKIGNLELNQRDSGASIGIYSPGGNPLVSLSGWRDGRLVLAEIISDGSQLEVRAVDMSTPTAGVQRVRSMVSPGNTYPVAGTSIQLSADDWGNPNESSPLLYLIASRQPTDVERAMIYEWMSARTGAVAW